MKNKNGAIELSIGTIVIIVLAMSMLILGLVLIRGIFTGATESVDTLDEKVKNEISGLFADGSANVIVKLGSDKTAKIKPDTPNFGIGIGARTNDGSPVDRNTLKYKLTLDTSSDKNCARVLGVKKTEDLFVTSLNQQSSFDDYDGSNAFARIILSVPKGTTSCTQKVFVDVTDTQNTQNPVVGGNSFIIEITKAGFFG